ncbi:MAG: nucleoid-associated protein [Clostridia bacterium]
MNNLNIEKLIVHILDSNIQTPVLSEQEHPLDDEINDFIEGHVSRILKDDNLKSASFIDEENRIKQLCTQICSDKDSFSKCTTEIASTLYNIMLKNVDIPSADVIFCLFELDGYLNLAVMKLNYRHSFIHYVQTTNSGRINSIIKQKTTLPAENQKVDECAIINLTNLTIKLLEKKYDIDGEKLFYFSQIFLRCTTQISTNEKIKIFSKATEKFSKKYFEEDYTKPVEIKKAVAESIEETDTINVINLAENIFSKNPELKREYIQEIENAGIRDKAIPVTERIAEKRFKTQKIKTDTGIEINLPIEYYGNKEKIEFINNPDGTISIVIKNINKISDK